MIIIMIEIKILKIKIWRGSKNNFFYKVITSQNKL